MRTLHRRLSSARSERRGVALLMALLLLVVLIAITIQISVTTSTDARIARNDHTLSMMDLAIESALLQVDETLKTDAESAGDAGGGGAAPGGAAAPSGASAAGAGGAAAAGGGEPQASDSRRDEWAQAQRTTINDIQLRIFVQDEDSKYNVLNMLSPDEKVARAAYDRVVRILDGCRAGSREFDIDPRTADEMAKAMLEHMQRRKDSKIPRPKQLTDREDTDQGLPLSLEEFAALRPFEEHHFRDLRDRDGEVVHSIGSFLTVWTSLGIASDLPPAAGAGNRNATAGAAGSTGGGGTTGTGGSARNSGTGGTGGATAKGGAGSTGGTSGGTTGTAGASAGGASGGASGQAGGAAAGGTAAGGTAAGGASGATNTGGYGVNVNTAPAAVLKGLFDDRDLHPRFFDRVIEYRNLEEEKKDEDKSEDVNEDEEPELDEYGQEKIERRILDSIGELSDVEGFKELPAEAQASLNQLLTTTSNVFSIFVVARKTTSIEGEGDYALTPSEQRKKEEQAGDGLVRVVRCVVWRHTVDEEIVLTPIVRWEILDYLPFEVLDFPPDDR